jgi:hypothetical protein
MESLLTFLGSIAWPATVIAVGYYLRDHINGGLVLLRQQIGRGASLKYKDFELLGVPLDSSSNIEGKGYTREPAEDQLLEKRDGIYKAQKNLFVVHRVKPTGEFHSENKLPIYEVLIYLFPHKSFGAINDVKMVEYYFGHYFGKSKSKNGTKYVVKNGSEAFAVKVTAYGPMLCEAKIIFQDGTETLTNRYLDFEGTGYKFAADTVTSDQKMLSTKKRGLLT